MSAPELTEVDGWDGEWVDGPPVDGRCCWVDRLEPLRSRPGEWARFGPFYGAGKQVGHIRRGKYGAGFDARLSRVEHQDWVYVKFEEEP